MDQGRFASHSPNKMNVDVMKDTKEAILTIPLTAVMVRITRNLKLSMSFMISDTLMIRLL